ncbi:hypothetical protein [Streptomyces decoyicus]|uniref:hypothetical protein n=1 Tax=Streptomyces decoyicus TaxID=249567 RepID=UPI002E17E4E8|nr:hypothetical protein OG532_33010 [Streptomyces decoyicus]
MNQMNQEHPGRPGQQLPTPAGVYAPPPPKKKSVGAKVGIGCGGAFGALDFTGGMLGPHQSEGKLIASVFADWKQSKNGLVTRYDAQGEILSNGNF